MNTPRERAIRVVEQKIREAQERVDDMKFLLAVLQDAANMDREFPYDVLGDQSKHVDVQMR